MFGAIAERLANELLENQDGIAAGALPVIMESITNGKEINLYPGGSGGPCCAEAVFIAIEGKLKGRRRHHLSFREALMKLVQHFQACKGKTKAGAVISTDWSGDAFEDWKGTIREIIRAGNRIEFYLIGKGVVNAITL